MRAEGCVRGQEGVGWGQGGGQVAGCTREAMVIDPTSKPSPTPSSQTMHSWTVLIIRWRPLPWRARHSRCMLLSSPSNL